MPKHAKLQVICPQFCMLWHALYGYSGMKLGYKYYKRMGIAHLLSKDAFVGIFLALFI